jgi:hypothetical protein
MGLQGETECVVWADSQLHIDFGHTTRLEKVVGERFKHVRYTPFQRAGICVADCLLGKLFENFEERPHERLAPEFCVVASTFDGVVRQTEKTGGVAYIDCCPYQVGGTIGDMSRRIMWHNGLVNLSPINFEWGHDFTSIVLRGPFLWASCRELADSMLVAEQTSTEAWQALSKDPVSIAIAKGWYHQLDALAGVGARVLFRLY